jgi:LemA protein
VGLYIGLALIVVAIYLAATFNRLVAIRQAVKESWSAIETELTRRFDLIPNLVETVKGYAGHERGTLEAVVKARAAAQEASSKDSVISAQGELTGALGKLMALAESYPELKASENFQQLQGQLSDTETRISQARRFYNANVKELNTAIETFPNMLIAGPMGFKSESYFGSDKEALAPVKVSFAQETARSPEEPKSQG